VLNFLAYEKERNVELVRKRVPVDERGLTEAIAEMAANELTSLAM
jgi:hypothetical protein